MAITGDVRIKVNTVVLKEKAQTVSRSIKKMERCFDMLERIVNRTSYYWIGEAGDTHRRIYKEQKPKVDEMMKRLKEHPKDLLTISQTYETGEREADAQATELPTNVID